MRRVAIPATFVIALAVLLASAQRSRTTPGHSVSHSPSLAHTRAGSSGIRTFGMREYAHSGFHGIRRDVFSHGFHHRHCLACRSFGFPWWGYGSPGYYDPYLWGSFEYDDYRFDEEQAREEALAREMDQVNLEEQQLREREEAWNRRASTHDDRPHESESHNPTRNDFDSAPPLPPSTVLVFRDRHQQEVESFAIANGTIWILNSETAKKVPLSSLDLEATQKANDDRGVEFRMPSMR